MLLVQPTSLPPVPKGIPKFGERISIAISLLETFSIIKKAKGETLKELCVTPWQAACFRDEYTLDHSGADVYCRLGVYISW